MPAAGARLRLPRSVSPALRASSRTEPCPPRASRTPLCGRSRRRERPWRPTCTGWEVSTGRGDCGARGERASAPRGVVPRADRNRNREHGERGRCYCDASRRRGSRRDGGPPRRRHSQACVWGPPGWGAGLGKVVPKELTGRQGAQGAGATALPFAGEPPGGFLFPGVIVRSVHKGGGPCARVNNCSLR